MNIEIIILHASISNKCNFYRKSKLRIVSEKNDEGYI